MTDVEIRLLEPDEYRMASAVFQGSVLSPPANNDEWARNVPRFADVRAHGAFQDDRLVGTVQSYGARLAVPGGAVVPAALITRVGVRADYTRRGVLTALKRAQLRGLTEPVATLRASEGLIYGRFGYGVATRGRLVMVDRRRAVFHPDVPAEGRLRMVPVAEGIGIARELYERFGPTRPGWVSREDFWWAKWETAEPRPSEYRMIAVHTGPDGDDGFAMYSVTDGSNTPVVLKVKDLAAGSSAAWSGLWRFLLSIDLVDEVWAEMRPIDEPLELLFTDRRVVRQVHVEDETWLRLVDVPTMLAAREFGIMAGPNAGSLVLDVRDDLFPGNTGCYRIGDGPACRVDEPADLVMDVTQLGALYLGDVAPSALAAAGRLVACTPDALPVADRLFAVPRSRFCGTYF